MAMGELFLSGFVGGFFNVLLDRLSSRELLDFLRLEGFDKKIEHCQNTLQDISLLLQDAEVKPHSNLLKKWLEELEELAYDMEDILDEFEYEAIARKVKMDQLHSNKFLKHLPAGLCSWTPDAIRFRNHMRSQVDQITGRFDELCERRVKVGLKVIPGETSSRSRTEPLRPAITTSHTTGAVHGRDEDKNIILEMVKNDEPITNQPNPNVQVIPIVGMGGVGKTTLAQEIFHHLDLEESFKVKAWVCVSDGPFDVLKVSKSILMDITGSSSDQKDFNTVQNELKQLLSGKRSLVVLDDVWNISDRDWETLRCPFLESARGSKIIVTTRDKDVASTFTLNPFHALDLLSDDDCWSVFSMCLSEKREAISEHPYLKAIRKSVNRNCKGLPLAAKALGGLLRREHMDTWLKILDSRSWANQDSKKNEIPAALMLSYHHLPFHLRRCFSYSAIFPKDHEFEMKEVVPMWIAEGFVPPSIGNEPLLEAGCRYFRELEGRSMFQQSSRKDRITFVMHDLFHDLAESVFGNKCLRLEGESTTSVQLERLKKVRHFSYTLD